MKDKLIGYIIGSAILTNNDNGNVSGNKIIAIKVLRKLKTELSLTEARDTIEKHFGETCMNEDCINKCLEYVRDYYKDLIEQSEKYKKKNPIEL